MGRASTRIDMALGHLAKGPATGAQLADVLCTHTGDIARMMSQLVEKGRVRRIDGGSGRGSVAIYALPHPHI
jgi:DNA-binding MarR family transcriptional regulator